MQFLCWENDLELNHEESTRQLRSRGIANENPIKDDFSRRSTQNTWKHLERMRSVEQN